MSLGLSNQRDEVGGSCNIYGRDKKFTQNFSRETLREEDYFGYLGLDLRIILKYILKKKGMRV
jgi:hypothetical protein